MKPQQQSLFELEPAPWEQDEAGDQQVATVVFATGPQQPFDYLVPPALCGRVMAGQRVRAPFGSGARALVGYCVRVESRTAEPRRLRPLTGVVDEQALANPSMLRLAEWMADYYLCGLGQVLEAIVPAGVRGRAGTRETAFVVLPNHVAAALSRLKVTPKQARILNHLAAQREAVSVASLLVAVDCGAAMIRALAKKGLVELQTRRIDAGLVPRGDSGGRETQLELNADQQLALAAISAALNAGQQRTILVHGVTGSGKTEVYMQAIAEVLSFGRQAIVLVPEISLTPQTEARFRSRFGHVAVLHSHLSDVERRRHWEEIAAGRVQVVVGARSAVFAPAPSLGIIILDEEHESSFKQETAPRYHAREVALARARGQRVPLVLGSATPSLESWHRALAGEYQLVSLPARVFDRPLPSVVAIDLRLEFRDRRSRGAISRQLHGAMEVALREGGQAILLLNRRGYSTHIQCNACGHVVRCPECAIALTHHLAKHVALCHYCDYERPAPDKCPECGFQGIRYGGLGTQRLEAEVKARFPKHRCLRMDSDTMQKHGSHADALELFRAGEVRILVGTQMIAKGLDFPNVTLVGVINADTALHFPDFRAAERTFQLVTQVAGRTGRGEKGGRVLVQTFSPDHPAIIAAMRHDYATFAAGELPAREMLDYPPFAAMIRIVVRGALETTCMPFAEMIAGRVREALAGAEFPCRALGPAPAPIPKLRGQHRYQIQVHGRDGGALRAAVRAATAGLKPPQDVQWIVDVDPLDML
ncbi:MAG: primosomal protein N' [Pirellulales bacterium]